MFHVKHFIKEIKGGTSPYNFYYAVFYNMLGTVKYMIKNIFSAFFLVFIAELGDKTQLSTMLLASKSKSIWYTFIGSASALVLSSLIGVIAGSLLNKYIPEHLIQNCSGIAFIVIGLLLLIGKV